MNNKKIQTVSNNQRQQYIISYLKSFGYEIHEVISYKDDNNIILLPFMYPDAKKIIESFDNKYIIGGNLNNELFSLAKEKNIKLYDYYNNEITKHENAYLTAENTLGLVITNYPHSIKNLKVLIIGYGRIGKICAEMFSNMRATVSISARKTLDFALINVSGYNILNTEKLKQINEFDIIINTVPELILNSLLLDTVKDNALIVDLASLPGGVDFNYANKKNIKYIHALGLPGKYSPVSDAEILGKSIINILEERS